MTFETLDSISFYVGQKTKADRIAAKNCHLNGYHQVALEKENEAAMGELILRELREEYANQSAKAGQDHQGHA